MSEPRLVLTERVVLCAGLVMMRGAHTGGAWALQGATEGQQAKLLAPGCKELTATTQHCTRWVGQLVRPRFLGAPGSPRPHLLSWHHCSELTLYY